MLRSESADADAMLRSLADRLGAIPGLVVSVTRRRGKVRRLIGDLPYVDDLPRRAGPIEKIVVTVGGVDHWVLSVDGSLRFGTGTLVLGSDRAHNAGSFATWADGLLDAVVRQGRADHDALVGLRALIEQDRA